MENKKCLKCLSINLLNAAYCRFCHEKFDQSKTFVERKAKRRFSRKIIIAGGSALAVAAGFIFRRKSAHGEKRRAG